MVLMASFFLCIKMTLLFFYKRLFLVTVVSSNVVCLPQVPIWGLNATCTLLLTSFNSLESLCAFSGG